MLLPCRQFELSSLPGGFYSGDTRGSDGIFNTSIFSVPLDAAALAQLPASIAAARIKVSATVGQGLALGSAIPQYPVLPLSSLPLSCPFVLLKM